MKNKMEQIRREMEKKGLMLLKGKNGVIRLWYEVGRRLLFLRDSKIVPLEDRKYIWRAVYDHAGNLIPGSGRTRAEQYKRNHFYYCTLLAEFDWSFVNSVGSWRSWVEFFDSEVVREDHRIIEWLQQRSSQKPTKEWVEFAQGNRQKAFRKLMKAIRQHFKKTETKYLADSRLFNDLDIIFEKVLCLDKNGR